MTGTPKNMIALSAGGDQDELAEHGLGIEHVEELMVRLSRRLLQAGYRLAYGGTLGNPKMTLTELLIDAAVGWLHDDTGPDDANKTSDILKTESWPLVNYGAWPYHTWVENEHKARLVGVCAFRDIKPPDVQQKMLSERLDQWPRDPIARCYTADALTEMRKVSTCDTHSRIVWGGKIRGADGWMAGIAEEVLFSIKHQKPVLILGGFGGCARVLADFLADSDASWPDALKLEDACKDKMYRERIINDTHHSEIAARFQELHDLVKGLRDDLQANEPYICGVPAEIFKEGLETTSASHAIRLALEVAQL